MTPPRFGFLNLEDDDASSTTDMTLRRRRHPKYYNNLDKLSIFLVSGCLFQVQRSLLTRESTVFEGMFACPPPRGQEEGDSDSAPIIIPDVSQAEFEALLEFLYEGMHDTYSENMTLEKAINLLSVSTRFECDNIKRRALEEITSRHEEMEPFDAIELGLRFHRCEWVARAFIPLAERSTPLALSEVSRLPLDIATLLWHVREHKQLQILEQDIRPSPPSPWGTPVPREDSPPISEYDDIFIQLKLTDWLSTKFES
ncbi:hypothetical protein EVG20_g3430 [Dentipellis fragilis]|uniref:BTB domain-containing protein n=1 Tax=Dentipellis fragilis TaxID=205917 RepID=A0A4Y9Z2D1_9AGAM|nr:hypothetical protein EVG20_g3430 [Dentipellis fragilis]